MIFGIVRPPMALLLPVRPRDYACAPGATSFIPAGAKGGGRPLSFKSGGSGLVLVEHALDFLNI
jgi:hypothetical protein